MRLAAQRQTSVHSGSTGDVKQSLRKLISDWYDTERLMDNIFAHEQAGAVSLKTDPAFRERIGVRLKEVEETQLSILNRLTELPALNAQDVLAKMKVWQSMACPTSIDGDVATPADRLIVRTISDFESLIAVQQDQISS